MKRIFCIAVSVLVLVSALASTVGAVSYADLRPTYTRSPDYQHYVHVNYENDERLTDRANCYGFAMRIHYNGDLSLYDFYRAGQLPGEFADRTVSGVTFNDLTEVYINSALAVAGKVQQDCAELGYTYTLLCASTSTTYIPPEASAQPNKRLVALVGKNVSNGVDDYHFYIQSDEGTWTHKMGVDSASAKCIRHTSVALTDENISQHVRCAKQVHKLNQYQVDVEEMYSNSAIFFYIDAPGTTDMSHYYRGLDSYQTIVRQYEGNGNSLNKFECAGNKLISAERLQMTTYVSRTGYINHINDEDYFIFDVSQTRNYTIRIVTDTSYDIRIKYADVTNLDVDDSPSFGSTHLTSNTGQTSFSVNLTAGRKYCLYIYSVGQTAYEADRYYLLNIS